MDEIETWWDCKETFCYWDWIAYYHILPGLIQKFQLQVGAEIGVAFGLHAKRILDTTNIQTLYCVDPWDPNHNWNCPRNEQAKYIEALFERVKSRLTTFGSRSVLIRSKSIEAAKRFQNHQLDFIFIDAAHDYVSVMEDLNAWYDKVRPGGIVSGDDYCGPWPGVIQACNEFFHQKGLVLNQHPDSSRFWWVQKPLED